MTSTVFSSLSKGYGSWDNGDLEARDDKTLPKPILPNLLEAEDVAFKDKSLNIPLRTKTPQSMVAELIKTKNVMPPPEDTYTVYSRPKTANSNSPRYPAATPRAQSSPARIARVKSAPPTSSRQQKPTKPNGELVLPKTFLTRRGAMLLFTAPEDLKFSQEQKCYQEQERSADVFDLGLKLRTMNKLTASVLQYGQDLGPETDFESYSSHYDKTFIKFPRETDDESAMDIHAQPGGDYSFYLRDLQVRTQGGMGYRPSSGRSVTSELERAELTEELRKMDAGDASSHGYRITADVNQLTEPYTQPSSRPSSGRQKVQKSRKPTSAKAVLSAMKLAASLKSANYLGRSFGSPYLPMTITPWERVDTPSDLIDVPMGASDSTSRPQTADLISLRSRRSLTSAGSGVGQRSETGDSGSAIQGQGNGEEVFESTTDEPIRDMYLVDEPITALDTDAIAEDTVEPITDLIETMHSDNVSKADEQSVVSEKQIIECDDNDVDIDINIDIDADVDDKEAFDEIEHNEILSVPAVGEHNEILSLPAVSDPGIEDKGDVEQANNEGFIDGGRISRAASVPVSMATEGEEDEWMGQNVEEERPLSAMSAAELEKLEEQRLTTTPASEKARSAASSRKPSVAGSEKARSVGSRPGSRPGSVMEPMAADSRPGSVKAESGIGSERGRSWVASESVSVRSEAENDGIEETINAAQPLQAPYQVVMTTGDEAAGLVQSEAEPVAEDAADTMAEYTAEPSTVEPSESGELIRPATAESQKPATPGSEVNSVKSTVQTEKPQEAEDPTKSSLPRKTATTASGVPKDVLVIPQEKTTANQKDADKSTNQKALSPANQKPATPPAAKKTETLKDVQDTTVNKKQDSAESAKSAAVKTPTPPKQARKISVPSPRASTTAPPTRPVSSKKETPAPAPPPQPKKEGLDLSELKSLVTKKNDSSEKPKSRKVAPAKKEKKRKGNKMQFVDSLGIESYGPSKEEIELMVQEELAKQLAAKNLTEMAPKDSDDKRLR
ncbi:microtubule-associated protein futsch-like isoform X1 [Ptychodera flava]|uniref:microtubule-associated protein futsch-like isoform X1 n=1 Tax=Ptychodera flava TaxID=63121 RepID=UPI00396AB002